MEQYQTDQILNAYERCYGLQDAFNKYADSEEKMMRETIYDTLGRQAGLRPDFIKDNKETIKQL